MEGIKSAWNGKDKLSLVFWAYFVLGQFGMALFLVAITGLSTAFGAEFFGSVIGFIVVIPFVTWATWSVWACAYNVKWRPWGYVARAIVVFVVIEKCYTLVI